MSGEKFGQWGGPSLRTLLLDHALSCSRRSDSASATDAYDTEREEGVEAGAFLFAAHRNSIDEAIAHYEARPRSLRVSRDDAQRAVDALRRFSERLRKGEL